MKHLSRKYNKKTLRKTRNFRKKSRKTVVRKRNYQKRNTRKRRRMGGMYEEEEDIELGRVSNKPKIPFINPNLVPPPSSTLKPPTPSNEPSWKGLQRTSKKNIERYLKKGDFSRPPLTDSAEDRELLRAYAPEVFEKSEDEYKTPRSSITSSSYGTPKSEEEKDPLLDIYTFKNEEDRNRIAKFLKSNDTYSSSDEDEDYYSEKNRLKRLEERRRNIAQTMKDWGYEK